ncbi:OLC1v1018554C1 [Oldenlandia corymbosa var. corymbosa]|uniref:OLC1v1018554C1 n=1 Tax=Oldenlandia corymbosa var. corymbosa TaxID=529605 RepID=A0AAV1EBW6_OLDCO|nr:OLC1v1018554C1 [Oldenlandia corymbosa var. corymbosa]
MVKIGRETELRQAELAYQAAAAESGNRKEEGERWANVIANICMNDRGAYLDALKLIKKDYLNESYPKKTSFLLVVLLVNSISGSVVSPKPCIIRSECQKYFISAMNLAKNLKENRLSSISPFPTVYIDAHNNLGMLEMALDNLERAENILTSALKICNEQEVGENDDSCSGLHHNLGIIYMEFMNWKEAEEHIQKAISICKNMTHYLGEAKALVNLGVLYYRVKRYDKAISCYADVLYLAKSLEDEEALVYQVVKHIDSVKAAIEIMKELKQGKQNIKNIEKNIEDSSISNMQQRRCTLFVEELCDKEKLADSLLVIGESNQKLRKFEEALTWYRKRWETYSFIGDFEGQAASMVNMGLVLDFKGCWKEAFRCFEEGYRIASEAHVGSAKLSAMENMDYSYKIRFDNVEINRMFCIFTLEGAMVAYTPVVIEKSCCSSQLMAPTPAARACGRIYNYQNQELCMIHDEFSIEHMKVIVACLYYLQLPSRKRESGLVPEVQDIKCDGRTLQTLEAETLLKTKKHGECRLEGILGVWKMWQKVKLYSDCCKEHYEMPYLKVLKNLFNPEEIEDEIIASHYGLHDVSVAPLLDVLHGQKAAAIIDLSRNILDLSACGLTPHYILRPNAEVSSLDILVELNLAGNPMIVEGASALAALLAYPECCLRVLALRKCQLGLIGILKVLESLSQNNHLKELHLAENIHMDGNHNTSPQRSKMYSDCHFVGNLSTAVEIEKHLKI